MSVVWNRHAVGLRAYGFDFGPFGLVVLRESEAKYVPVGVAADLRQRLGAAQEAAKESIAQCETLKHDLTQTHKWGNTWADRFYALSNEAKKDRAVITEAARLIEIHQTSYALSLILDTAEKLTRHPNDKEDAPEGTSS